MKTRRQQARNPPPLDQGAESLDGAPIFDELAADEALVLWKTVRSVRLWARVPAEQRAEAFDPAARGQRMKLLRAAVASRPLRAELETLAGVLGSAPADAAEIAGACGRVARWAEERGAIGTALEFTQAAAFATPEDASLARQVALLARRHGEFARAETWYRHAVTLGRRTKDWRAFILSYIGLGAVYTFRGNYPAARKATLRALHAARRHSARELAAMAYHDLAAISSRTGRAAELHRYARAALDAYGKGHQNLPALAHDVATFWMQQGYFAQALEVFRAVPPEQGPPFDRLMRAAAVARAAGALGDRRAYAAASRDASRLLGNPAAAQGWANALVNLSRGAEMMGLADEAHEYATRARQIALARGEAESALEAEGLIESSRAERAARAAAAVAPKAAPRQVAHLAGDLVAAVAGA